MLMTPHYTTASRICIRAWLLYVRTHLTRASGGVGVLGEGARCCAWGSPLEERSPRLFPDKGKKLGCSAPQGFSVGRQSWEERQTAASQDAGLSWHREPGAAGGCRVPQQPREVLPACTEAPKLMAIHPFPANKHQQNGQNPLYRKR